MIVPTWLAELINKYSFISNYKIEGTNYIFYLHEDCKIKKFNVNRFRMSKNLLLKKIKNIKNKIGYNNETGDWEKQTKN